MGRLDGYFPQFPIMELGSCIGNEAAIVDTAIAANAPFSTGLQATISTIVGAGLQGLCSLFHENETLSVLAA